MLKRYETYKDSGADWIGGIPEKWESVKLKWISDITKGRKPKKELEQQEESALPYLSMEFLRDKTSSPTYIDLDERGLVLVDDNDLLILWDGSKAGEIVKAKKGVLSSTMAKIEITDDKLNTQYLNYLLVLAERHIQSHTIGMGIPHVSGDVLKDIPMLVPSQKEQTQIAAYLDHQTNLIDAIIAQKEQLIDKLKEQRQAIINETVTKGINPDTPLKDSGIEWLGEIPEHWEVVKLKYFILELESGVSVNSESTSVVINDDEYGILKTSAVFDYDFNPNENKKVVLDEYDRLKCPVRKDSIIISRMNTPDLVGSLGYINEDIHNLFLPDRLWQTVIAEGSDIDIEFLSFILKSDLYRKVVRSKASGTSPSMKNITKYDLLETPIPRLPLIEQIQIKEYLKKLDSEMNDLLIKLELSVRKLKEYRQSIISEAVTGKIDVRDWKPENA